MSRLPRFNVPDYTQHVIQRGVNRGRIFFEPGDYGFFLECLNAAAEERHVDIHAYVLMPTHVHLLGTPRRKDALSGTMQVLGRRYAGHINLKHERTGTLWEGRFRSTVVDGGEYLLTCHRYIELNPVRAGIVKLPGTYPYSSYRHYVVGEPDPLIKPHPAYLALGETVEARRAAYRELFHRPLDAEIVAALRRGTNHGWAVGRECFKRELEVVAKRRAMPKPRGGRRPGAGRPRKVRRER